MLKTFPTRHMRQVIDAGIGAIRASAKNIFKYQKKTTGTEMNSVMMNVARKSSMKKIKILFSKIRFQFPVDEKINLHVGHAQTNLRKC